MLLSQSMKGIRKLISPQENEQCGADLIHLCPSRGHNLGPPLEQAMKRDLPYIYSGFLVVKESREFQLLRLY